MRNEEYRPYDLINMDEGKTFDRKSAKYDVNKLANILIAFANADGGMVAIGIDDGKFEGIDFLSSPKINDFLQVGAQRIIPTLKVSSRYVYSDDESKRILLLSVKPSEDKIYSNKKDEVFLRIGDETHKVTYDERKNLEYDKGIRSYESQEVKDALLDDLDSKTVQEYKKIYGFDGDNLWDLLFPKGLEKRSLDSSNNKIYKLTVAGVLLLAKFPTAFIPGARIRFIRYEGRKAKVGTEMNIVKQKMFEGPINKMLSEVSRELESQLRTFSSLDEKTGKFTSIPEYPKGAWLEGIVNAVTHRSYNYTGDDIRITMYDDHLDIHSPGGLPAVVNVNNIRKTHYSRNPYIARALTDFGWVKEFGEGVDRIYKDMNEYFLDDPIYEVDKNSVCLVLKNNIVMRSFRKNKDLEMRLGNEWKSLNYVEKLAVKFVYEHGNIKTRELANQSADIGLSTARNALRNLTKKGIFRKVATSPTSPKQYYELIK